MSPLQQALATFGLSLSQVDVKVKIVNGQPQHTALTLTPKPPEKKHDAGTPGAGTARKGI